MIQNLKRSSNLRWLPLWQKHEAAATRNYLLEDCETMKFYSNGSPKSQMVLRRGEEGEGWEI